MRIRNALQVSLPFGVTQEAAQVESAAQAMGKAAIQRGAHCREGVFEFRDCHVFVETVRIQSAPFFSGLAPGVPPAPVTI